VSIDTAAIDEDQDDPPPEPKQHRTQPSKGPRRCKRCSAVLGPEPTTRFGDHPAYDVYICAACGFIEWVAVSWVAACKVTA
jgi:hypothetical protein